MSLFRANDPEDAPKPDETPVLEGAPGAVPFLGQDSVTPPRRIPHLGHALLFVSFTECCWFCLSLFL